MKKILKVVLLIGLLLGGYLMVKNILRSESWDLMVCKSLLDDGSQCYENSYVLKGYRTQAECMEKGLELAKKEGFECGKNCRHDVAYDADICDIICNKSGCKD